MTVRLLSFSFLQTRLLIVKHTSYETKNDLQPLLSLRKKTVHSVDGETW